MDYVVQAWSAPIKKDIKLLEISPQHLINDEYDYFLDYSEQNIVESYFDLKFENFTGKNPYQSCQYDKSFSDNSGLTGHLQSHTKEMQAWSPQIRKDINLLEIAPQHLINDKYNYSLDYSEQNIVELYLYLKFENFTGKNVIKALSMTNLF